MNTMHEKIMEILKNEVDLDDYEDLSFSSSLRKDLDLDSLDLSVFILAVEEEYETSIPDETLAELDSVEQIAGWITQQ